MKLVASTCLLAAWSMNAVGAQTAPTPEAGKSGVAVGPSEQPQEEVSSKAGSSADDSASKKMIIFRDLDGQLVPVPRATLKEFHDWFNHRDRPKKAEYAVTSVAISGKADDERAELTATITVQLDTDQKWVLVPLHLNEAVIKDSKYEGDGEASPGENDRLERGVGYRWWFKGKGLHKLTLTMLVPVRKQVPTRRLQLVLPSAPQSFLKLEIPLPAQQLKVTPPPNSSMKPPRQTAKNRSQVEVFGLGTNLNLQWQSLPKLKKVETVLRATTSIEVSLTGDTVLLTGTQRIRAQPGSFEDVTVRLPAGFELRDVEGAKYKNHQADPSDPRRITVHLEEPTDVVDLKWKLESSVTSPERVLTLEGFEVEGARYQTGDIEVSAMEGYRISKREGKHVSRKDVRQPVGNVKAAATAYYFLKQPFRLVLDVREIEPYFTVEPHLLVHMSVDQAKLVATFVIDVVRDRGAVRDIELIWPGWKSEGWKIERSMLPAFIEDLEFDTKSGDESIRFHLVEPRTGRFELSFSATRAIKQGDESFHFSLPTVTAPRRLPSTLVVLKSHNIETELLPDDETSTRSLSREAMKKVVIAAEFLNLRRTELLVDSLAHTFTAKVTEHDQEIAVDTTAKVKVVDGRLHVTQRIAYNVKYEPLSPVRLLIPRELARPVEFFSGDDTPLTAKPTERSVGTAEEVRVTLTEQGIGQFDVVAKYSIELKKGRSSSESTLIQIPLILPSDADAEYSSVRIEAANSDQAQIEVTDDQWNQQLTMQGANVWTVEESRAEIPLKVTQSASNLTQDYSVRRAMLRTWFQDGHAFSVGQYQIDGDPATVVVTFPEGIRRDRFWWGQRELTGEEVSEIPIGSGKYQLTIPKTGDDILTIEFRSTNEIQFGWGDAHRLSSPEFPPSVWVDQTAWEVTLPFEQHLFTNPPGFTHRYRWQRGMFFWSRNPDPQTSEVPSWMTETAGSYEKPDYAVGNTYQFSRFGPSQSLAFHSMSRSFVVLFGAGLALLVGFVLLKIPATRNMLTLLVLIFVLAVVSLWYAAPVQLLLQPAILGLLLAIAAAAIDSLVTKKRTSTIVTLSSPSDFVGPSSGSSIDRRGGGVVGSEELTAIRPTQPVSPEPVSTASESGPSE